MEQSGVGAIQMELFRWKGKQVQILYELVTVIREQKPKYHWETGKMADVMIFKPGDLPDCCTETIVSDHE